MPITVDYGYATMGKNLSHVDFEDTEHFRAWFYIDEDTGLLLCRGKYEQVFSSEKAEEQVATDIFKVSITGGIELSYIISQNCPHICTRLIRKEQR